MTHVLGIVFAVTLVLGATSSRVMASEYDCAAILANRGSDPAPEVRDQAREVLAWFTLTHPFVRRALERSYDWEFLLDMVHVPTGFALPPAGKGAEWQAYAYSGRFELKLFFPDWPRQTLVGEVEQAASMGAASREARVAVTDRILRRGRQMIDVLAREENFPRDKGDVPVAFRRAGKLAEAHAINQNFVLRWSGGFTPNDFVPLARMKRALGDRRVVYALVRELHSNLPRVIRAHRALVKLVGEARTENVLRARHRAWEQTPEYATIAFWAEGLENGEVPAALPPPPSARDEFVVPEGAEAEASEPEPAAEAPESTPALAPSVVSKAPPPPPVEHGELAPFDGSAIEQFLPDARMDLDRPLERLPLLALWTLAIRAGNVLTDALGQVADWRTEEPDWAAWRASMSTDGTWGRALNAALASLQLRRVAELDRLPTAAPHLAALAAYVNGLSARFRSSPDFDREARALGDRDQRMLGALLAQIQSLTYLLDAAERSLKTRENVLIDLNLTTNQVSWLVGDLERQRIEARLGPVADDLAEALETLASAPEGYEP